MVNVDQKIAEFKECGTKVRINHYRRYQAGWVNKEGVLLTPTEWVTCSHKELRDKKAHGNYNPKYVENKGGKTTVELTLPDGTELKGESICCLMDNFCRRTGKRIAWGRLMKEYDKYLAASPEAKKYGDSQGNLILGMFYLTVVNDVVYEVYPAQGVEQLSVEESTRWSLSDFNFHVAGNNIQELKEE